MEDEILDEMDLSLPALDVNLSPAERGVSITLGAALLAFAFSQRRVSTGAALGLAGAYVAFRGISGHCALYEALDLAADEIEPEDERLSVRRHRDASAEATVTIAREVDEVYGFWRRLENLPRFLLGVHSVTALDDTRSHWEAHIPEVGLVAWEAEILEDRPGELIAWRSLGGSEVHHSGAVQFRPAPGGRGTEVRLSMEPFASGGRVSRWLARLVGWGTERAVAEDLRRLKQLLETGEVPTTEGQPSGRHVVPSGPFA
jgi:uncharacterized membrane protein